MSVPRSANARAQTVVTGVMLLVSGAVLWAGARGWYSIEQAWAWWPLGLLFPAVHRLTAPPPERRVFGGLAWLAAAAVLVAVNLGTVDLRLSDAVAIIFIIAGARLTYVAWMRRRTS